LLRQLRSTKFHTLSLADPFFDSLKAGYKGFEAWFKSKADEELYVVDDGRRLSGMIYLKQEDGPVSDVEPPLPRKRWLKVGTLKIEGRGTKLGERVLKKILDTAIEENRDGIFRRANGTPSFLWEGHQGRTYSKYCALAHDFCASVCLFL
jgi:hypothetical protein